MSGEEVDEQLSVPSLHFTVNLKIKPLKKKKSNVVKLRLTAVFSVCYCHYKGGSGVNEHGDVEIKILEHLSFGSKA